MAQQITGQAQGSLVLQTSQKSGTPAALPTGWHTEALLSELLPRYSNLVQAGVVFQCNFPAAAFAAPSASAGGAFFLFNPANSGKNLHILDTQVAITAFTAIATAAMAVAIIPVPNQTPSSTTSTGFTAYNALIGSGNASVAKGFVTSTLSGAPVLGQHLIACFSVLTAVGTASFYEPKPIDGAVVVAPGSGIN